MGRSIGGEVIRPIKNALDDMPIHVRQLGDMIRKHRAQQRRNHDGVDDVDRFDSTVTTRGANTKTTLWDTESRRPIAEHGHIGEDFGSSTRGDNATDIGNLGEATDDGGHLGAHRFYGDTPDVGIVPQASNLNRGAWKKMENEWADWSGQGYHVDYEVDVLPPGSVRPDRFEVSYTVTDPATGDVVRDHSTSFNNAAGELFDRIPRADIPKR
ncbi:DNA/RNA non-specific endonuclease [Microbacterium aerolatum]|uniref:DNA/RNA non-specific endonuclease n=1 Tax=Microbacterium aerolatum TaxID=153731 RepID=UPI0020017EFE|nr:DNA/RNA non-specific endonuclease [Microbacterium aerolatum]MCK3768725.1 DNA/RNA non-specific endonuclease [Microbacterium aerolatum]